MPKKKPAAAKAPRIFPAERAQLLLAIDAAGAAGIALFFNGHLVAHSPADGTGFKALLQVAAPLVQPYQDVPPGHRLCVIEQHWMNRASSKGSMTLGQRRGIAQSVGEALGFGLPEYIPSSTWQAKLFGGRVDDTKEASMQYVRDVYNIECPTDDVADAICLGRFTMMHRLTHNIAVPSR